MDKFQLASIAYTAFYETIGGQFPGFDTLPDNQKEAWLASATASAGFRAMLGDDITSDNGVSGIVRSLSISDSGRGYWIEAKQANGKPFDHYVNDLHLVQVNGVLLRGK